MNDGDKRYRVEVCDCLAGMKSLSENSIDSIVTDPPYGLEFMGKEWDHGVPATQFWKEALRVAKHGAHLLAFGGTRTYHRLACAIEDAGWEIRDCVMWVYGSGFPKSMDVSKAIDKAAGAEREVVGMKVYGDGHVQNNLNARNKSGRYNFSMRDGVEPNRTQTAPATEASRQWEGWGTALKPAYEPIIVARKPLCGTVAENVLKHGTGAIHVDACRVKAGDAIQKRTGVAVMCGTTDGYDRPWKHDPIAVAARQQRADQAVEKANELGRFPANLIHDGSDEVMRLFPNAGGGFGVRGGRAGATVGDFGMGATMKTVGFGDAGSAARFFYCAKASKSDRDEGLDGFQDRPSQKMGDGLKSMMGHPSGENGTTSSEDRRSKNFHPTVKPTALMRYLCTLVTQPNGVILDPFMGSGSTGKAAMLEGFRFIGMEMNEEYANIGRARIAHALETSRSTESEPNLFEDMEQNEK